VVEAHRHLQWKSLSLGNVPHLYVLMENP